MSEEIQKLPHPELGDKDIDYNSEKVICLIVDDHVRKIDAKEIFGLKCNTSKPIIKNMDPNYYYLTSGEALQKVLRLEKDAKAQLVEIKKLKELLKLAKGPSKYLEIHWDNHYLILRRKDPRKKVDIQTSNDDPID